ncbi:hypothetical protein EJF18_30185 [Clavispora lusitaniae]|uniref:Uncharacterized protein n=1 Tax=Clavispora lusitaniae TaxID=36911 RepID=A0ACD0WID1_CLALS|nr:hypothetical protein EJF14_30185 [Clavispora lusitaniae]QFZ33470.1 hypothetical protein EJF16_30185 [Clavispora lusitaniae]QFZ39141.1 hypothetical protein EJF15_30185 [Clavispora lusitaniae]QFZ44823.1 hypothetical protein EJF18_30185 [Clavispora lusitaniae]QFZ50500.1 hypothetical protein EJF17_30185 [Clavispora lusitaniae]
MYFHSRWGHLVVVVAWLTQELSSVNTATVPASRRFLFFHLHPVCLVVLASTASASNVTVADVSRNLVWVLHGAFTFEDWVFHVENIHTFHLTQQFESFQTGGLVQVGWDSSWLGTRTDQGRVWTRNLGQLKGRFGFNFGRLGQDSAGGQQSGSSGSTNKCTREPKC